MKVKELSIIKTLKEQNLINDEFIITLNNLELDDLIAIKLELSTRHLKHRPYGFDLWRKMHKIIKEALLKFAVSATPSKKAAARFLGLRSADFRELYKEYKIEEYYEQLKENKGGKLDSTG